MGGKAFRVLCSLVQNGISLQISTLPDSGAYSFAFLDTCVAVHAEKLLGVTAHCLKQPILPKGYNGAAGSSITHFMVFNIKIDGYQLAEIPFLILDLGNYNAILGNR